MKLRVGLVGLGDQWTTRHAPAFRALADRFEITAVCCEVFERARKVAAEFDATPMHGFRNLVDRQDIEAILYLSPQWFGPLPILAACDNGKAVYTSAALDVTPIQAAEIRHRVEAAGIAFMAELPRRYSPATLRMKELIATRIGQPQLLFCHQRLFLESQQDQRRKGQMCPIVWRNLMELVDWCRYLVGDNPNSVVSSIFENNDPQSNQFYQMVNLDFPPVRDSDGAASWKPMAQLSVGHYIPQRWPDALSFRRPPSVQIRCEKGMAFIDLPSNLIWFDDAGQHHESLEAERAPGEQMLNQFYRSVTSLVRHNQDPENAWRAMKIVVDAHRSASTNQRIEIDYDPKVDLQ